VYRETTGWAEREVRSGGSVLGLSPDVQTSTVGLESVRVNLYLTNNTRLYVFYLLLFYLGKNRDSSANLMSRS
jgi:hypothetical protein